MKDKIKYILEHNIDLLGRMDKAICYFREQQHDIALGIIADSIDLIKYSIEAIIADSEYFNLVSTDSIMEMLGAILEAYRKEDYILLADLLEMQMVSFLSGVQELIISKGEIAFEEEQYQGNLQALSNQDKSLSQFLYEPMDPQILLKEGYRVEFTSCGLMTLAGQNGDSQYYFHTNGRIQAEAFYLARHWYKKEVKEYLLYGLGFAYHIKELLSLTSQSKITVYESDPNVILLACAFTNIKDIFETGRIKLVYDPKYQKLEKCIKKLSHEDAFYVHYPSFQNIRCDKGRKIMKNYVSWSKI